MEIFTSVSIVGLVVVGLFASLWVLGGQQRSMIQSILSRQH